MKLMCALCGKPVPDNSFVTPALGVFYHRDCADPKDFEWMEEALGWTGNKP